MNRRINLVFKINRVEYIYFNVIAEMNAGIVGRYILEIQISRWYRKLNGTEGYQ